ncbi:MAG TPA: hypothetical protein VH105_08290 [Burkholderiales bacterium]|nr:hypothetical protein [Burkholderiales bacterium]
MTQTLRACLLLLIACLLPGVAGAAAEAPPRVHLSTEKEFVGTWKSIPVPLNQQPPESQSHPFLQGNCNYLVHAADGAWALVVIESYPGAEEKARRCNLSIKEVAAQAALLPDSMRLHWERKDGLFRMVGSGGIGFVWSSQTVESDGSISLDPQSTALPLKRGDLIMQMGDRAATKVLWRMVLRKVTR